MAVMHQLDEDGILGAATFRDNHHSIKRALEQHEADKPSEAIGLTYLSSEDGDLKPLSPHFHNLEPNTEYELILRKKLK